MGKRLESTVKSILILFGLVYGGFIVGDWAVSVVGLDQYGLGGTLIALLVPVILIYLAWKTWFKKQIR